MLRPAKDDNRIRFTKANVATLKLANGQAESVLWDAGQPGLGLRLRSTGGRTWVARMPRAGREKMPPLFTIGNANTIDLEAARAAVRQRLAQATLGHDPIAEKKAARARAALTIGTLTDAYLVHQAKQGRRKSTISNDRHALTVHWAPLRDRPLIEINRAEIAKRLGEIENNAGKFAGDRARSNLIAFFAWAIKEEFTEANPAANTYPLLTSGDRRRDRVLADDELRDIWRQSGAGDFGTIVRLLILTAQRRDEISSMSWAEIDLRNTVWVLPEERSKNRQAHALPLTPDMVAILKGVPRRNSTQFLFGARDGKSFSGWSKSKRQLDERITAARKEAGLDPLQPWRLHDLRRTARTGLASLRVPNETAEAILNHVGGFKAGVAAHYDRSHRLDDKLDALAKWGAHVAKIAGETVGVQS